MFKVTGVSKYKGKMKVRFANDMMRVKGLAKYGQTDIDFIELPSAMTKADAVKHLMGQTQFVGEAREAIEAANEKYNGAKTVKVKATKTKKSEPSMEDIMARAAAKDAETAQ